MKKILGVLVSIALITIFSAYNLLDLLMVGLAIILSLIIGILFKKKFNSWLNLYTVISFVYVLGYPVRYLFLKYYENKFQVSDESLIYALLFSFTCYLVFILSALMGARVKVGTDYKIEKLTPKDKRIILLANFLLTTLTAAFLVANFGGLSNFVTLLSNRGQNFSGLSWAFSWIASMIVGLIIVYASSEGIKKRTFLIYLFIGTLFLFLSGSRILILLALFPLVYLLELKRREPFKGQTIVTLFLLFIIFYSAFFAYFRTYIPTGSWAYFNENKVDLLLNTLVNGGLSFLDGLAVIMSHVPEDVNYLAGASIIAALVMYIPSFLIGNKPENGAALFNMVFNSEQYARGTGQNPSLLGELYWNFGSIFVVLAIFFIGVLIGLLTNLVSKANMKSNFISTLIFLLLIPIIVLHLKSGLGTATSFRILFPFAYNIILLFMLKKLKRVKYA